jgi:hypothetical protein
MIGKVNEIARSSNFVCSFLRIRFAYENMQKRLWVMILTNCGFHFGGDRSVNGNLAIPNYIVTVTSDKLKLT